MSAKTSKDPEGRATARMMLRLSPSLKQRLAEQAARMMHDESVIYRHALEGMVTALESNPDAPLRSFRVINSEAIKRPDQVNQ